VAVKKKSAAKKAAPKKSTAKKSATKKAAKKSPAKKTAAKKTVAKKTAAKKKSAAKKTTAKKVVKKAAAKKTTKKAVKKSAAKKSTSSKVVIPPVPTTGGSRVNVSTTPAPAVRPAAAKAASKPSAAPQQGSSGKVLLAVLVGVLALGAIVISNGKNKDDAPATSAASPSAMASASTSATPDAATTAAAATTGEAPSRFIGNWKDSSKSVMVITWVAPMGDIKGYKVETRSNQGAWTVVSELSATTLSAEFAKKSEDGSTSFRVTAVYADGSMGVAKAFGFAGQFE